MCDRTIDILVVDDNPILVSVLLQIFREDGNLVRTAHDGFEALAAFRSKIPNVLVSDLHMPNMSGFELLSVVRRRFASVAVIAMSGTYSGIEVPPGIAADAFYAKGSSSVAQLVDIVNRLRNKRTPPPERTQVPIWVSAPSGLRTEQTRFYVACPECLRAASHCVSTANGASNRKSCPHCCFPLDLALADLLL